MQSFSCFEMGNPSLIHMDAYTSSRIPRYASFMLLCGKRSKSTQFNSPTKNKGLRHLLEYSFYNFFGISLVQVRVMACNQKNQVWFFHGEKRSLESLWLAYNRSFKITRQE